MAKRLHPVDGPLGAVMARGWFANADTLEGLTGPVDPAFLLNLPRLMSPQDLALVVGLVALLTMGRTRCRATALARVCGLGPKSLPIALARLARWVPSVTATLDGSDIVIGAPVKRRLRPDFYVRLKVQRLARAPSIAHARFYVLAAWAAAGDETVARNWATMELAKLNLAKGVDPVRSVGELVAWVQPEFGDARYGRVLSASLNGDRVVVKSINSCNWSYDHRAAPRPWVGKAESAEARISVVDGAWNEIELSLPWLRIAKVCAWAKRLGCGLSATSFVDGWLIALRSALAGGTVEGVLSGKRLLSTLRRRGAIQTFEMFVLDIAARAGRAGGTVHWRWATPAARVAAEDARVLRRMAMNDPGDPRLKIHARCATTGEEFTAMQYARLIRRTMVHLRDSGASRAEIAATWQRLHANYRRIDAPARPPAPVKLLHAPSIGAEILIAKFAAPDWEHGAHDAALSAVVAASSLRCLSVSDAVDAGIAALRFGDATNENGADQPETSRWSALDRAWQRQGASEAGETFEAAVRRVMLAALAATESISQAA